MLARKLQAAFLLATLTLSGEQTQSLEEERRTTSHDRNGYRHSYTPRTSKHSIGLVVIGSTDELSKARELAHGASAALGLAYEDLEYDPDFGFTLSEGGCTEEGYPCAPDDRTAWMLNYGPAAYLSIEHSGGYERLDTKTFVVIAAHGAPGSELLSRMLTKAKATFPAAYQKTTRAKWIEYTQAKLPE
jgi:hypothetical protein